jgi:arsenite methyltransferase
VQPFPRPSSFRCSPTIVGNGMDEEREDPTRLKAEIRARFALIALSPQDEGGFLVGRESAKRVGYDADEIDSLPHCVSESFAGVGNPLALEPFRAGEIVLDLGSGAGLDSILAARRVEPGGSVIGIDFGPEMVEKARRNAAAAGVTNAEFRVAEIDALPLADESVDVVISNGVFNLCLDKPAVLAEACRVLRYGGRIQMADMLLEDTVTPEEVSQKGAWSA